MSAPSIPQVLKQEQIDPQSFNSRRCVFTLPEDFLNSNIKLCNLGVYDTNVTGKTGVFYPFGIGAASAILNLYLKANGETIDSMMNVGEYLTREYLRTSNQNSEDVNRFDILNAVNIGLNPENQSMSYNNPRADYFHTYGETGDGSDYCPAGLQWQLNNALDADANVTGVLHLRDVFGFFRAANVLPPMTNLTIEIEWERTGSKFLQDPRVLAAGVHNLASITPLPNQPFLVCDIVAGDPNMQAAPMEIPYESVVREVFQLAATGGDVQDLTFQSKGLKNKYVKDLTLLNQVRSLAAANTFPFNAYNLCPRQENERINLTVNGRKFLPLTGADTPALKQYYFDDAYDLLNVNYAAFSGVVDPSGRFLDPVDPVRDNINKGYAPAGFRLEREIDSLDIHYYRGAGTGAKDNSAMSLVMLATIAKKVLYNAGAVKIVS